MAIYVFFLFFRNILGLEKCYSARSKTRNNHRTDTDYNKYFVDRYVFIFSIFILLVTKLARYQVKKSTNI